MGFSSSNELVDRHSATCRKNASLQADLDWNDNPFRNLHPKMYLRQKRVSSKIIKDSHNEFKTDMKSSALLGRNAKNNLDCQTKLGKPTKQILQNAAKKHPLSAEKTLDGDYYLKNLDEVTYLNRRNISVAKKRALDKGTHSLPLIVTPKKMNRENKESLSELSKTLRESNTNYLPRIRCASFLSLVYEDEKKMERQWEERARYTAKSTSTCGPQMNESSFIFGTEGDNPKKIASDLRGYKGIAHSDVDGKERLNAVDIGSRNLTDHQSSFKTVNKCNTSKGVDSDINTVLRAKLHRSSFSYQL